MELFVKKCPSCGAQVNIECDDESGICPFCNSKIYIKREVKQEKDEDFLEVTLNPQTPPPLLTAKGCVFVIVFAIICFCVIFALISLNEDEIVQETHSTRLIDIITIEIDNVFTRTDAITPAVTEEPPNTNFTVGDTFEFNDFEITLFEGITWTSVQNNYNENYGKPVARIPARITNNSGETRRLSTGSVKYFGVDGTSITDVTWFFRDDSVLYTDLRGGAVFDGAFYILFDGNGDYFIEFSNWGNKAEVMIPIIKE
jgi:DNA-directed RNA polymerase subunit RPC12/RpoP